MLRVRPSARQRFEGDPEPGEMRQRYLNGILAVVQRQQRMTAEGENDRLVFFAENG